MGENDVCRFLRHLCMNVIMCKYLQAPNRNAGNLRSLCITLWEYMFRCTEIKLCLGHSIMLFKRYNIPSIWLRACTMLSSPLLFPFFFLAYFVTAPPACAYKYTNTSLYETTFVAMSYYSEFVCDKSACLKQDPSRTMFYPPKKQPPR